MAAKDEVAAYHEVVQLARTESPKAIRALVKILDTSEDERSIIAAANAVLDRAFGKPAQTVIQNGDSEGGPVRLLITGG